MKSIRLFMADVSDEWMPLDIRIKHGVIVNAFGQTGLTQVEDTVPVFGLNNGRISLPAFIWQHYHSILLEIDEYEGCRLVFRQSDGEVEVATADIFESPLTLDYKPGQLAVAAQQCPPTLDVHVQPKEVIAGSEVELAFDIRVGEEGIAEGGGIKILTTYTSWAADEIIIDDVEIISKDIVQIEAVTEFPVITWLPAIRLTVKEGELKAGDKITLKYKGNKSALLAQHYLQDAVMFRVLADIKGNGNFGPIAFNKWPSLQVIAGPPHHVRIAPPMRVRCGVAFDVPGILLDKCNCHVAEKYSKKIRLYVNEVFLGEADRIGNTGRILFRNVRIDTSGLVCLKIESEGLQDSYICIKATEDEPKEKLYWGQIHGHTAISDGEGSMDDYYRYGRDIGLLDVCAVTDHAWEIKYHYRNKYMNGMKSIVEIADKYYQAGTFVTIPAYEWMGDGTGHINVYYPDGDYEKPIYADAIIPCSDAVSVEKFLALYKNTRAILLPHASHGMKWDHYEEKLEPVVEMYSQWGSSEYECKNPGGVNDGLKKGYRFGFIGGADSHHGCPGQTNCRSRHAALGFREGLAAFWASELTRDGIMDSIRNRSTYATTGERIYLEFEINGVSGGNELSVGDADDIRCGAIIGGTSKINNIELIKNGEIIDANKGDGFIERYSMILPPKDEDGTDYYYLRVTQEDGEMAWSSPVWIKK